MHQFIVDGNFFQLVYFAADGRMPELWGLWVFELGVLFEEERELEDYFEGVLWGWVVVVQKAFDCFVVLEDGVVLELYLQLEPAHA